MTRQREKWTIFFAGVATVANRQQGFFGQEFMVAMGTGFTVHLAWGKVKFQPSHFCASQNFPHFPVRQGVAAPRCRKPEGGSGLSVRDDQTLLIVVGAFGADAVRKDEV